MAGKSVQERIDGLKAASRSTSTPQPLKEAYLDQFLVDAFKLRGRTDLAGVRAIHNSLSEEKRMELSEKFEKWADNGGFAMLISTMDPADPKCESMREGVCTVSIAKNLDPEGFAFTLCLHRYGVVFPPDECGEPIVELIAGLGLDFERTILPALEETTDWQRNL